MSEINTLVKYAGNHVRLGRMLLDEPETYMYLMEFVKLALDDDYYVEELLPSDPATIDSDEFRRRRLEVQEDWLSRIDHDRFKNIIPVLWMGAYAIRDVDADIANQQSPPSLPELRTSTRATLRQLQAAPLTAQVQVPALHLQSPGEVMQSVLEGMRFHNQAMYGAWLADNERVARAMSWVRPEVVMLFQSRTLVRYEDLVKLGGNLDYTGWGVYLHIVMVEGELRPRFYVGQAYNLRNRIHSHGLLSTRRNHLSLHYKAVEKAQWDVFVVLAYGPMNMDDADANGNSLEQLSLNFVEHFGSCLVRSLPRKELEKYIPQSSIVEPEIHLNVISPLFQGGTFQVAWMWALFKSGDPLHRQYIADFCLRSQKRLAEHAQSRTDIVLDKVLTGGEFKLYQTVDHRARFDIRYVSINITTTLDVDVSRPVYVETQLVDDGMIHPLRYAAKAVAGDPALRLAFELTIPLIGGGSTREFIQCQGLKAPLKVNSFVDWIEGNTDEEIGLRPRRFMLRHKGRGVAKWEYT